ncbi:MAG: hypothetical protein WEB03_14420 [Nitriliruptor sp.]|uniref:hypothetical protein n=1 Tax=Nitriliruptor sp. TaxID=2448056 RepID=UPI0034A02B20
MAKGTPLRHFLLVFDHTKGELIDQREFTRVDVALGAYGKTERQYEANDQVEVVLVGSDSMETVKVTHGNYFDGTVAISKYLAGLPTSR